MLITAITTDAAWGGAALAPWLVGVPLLSAAILLLAGRRSDRGQECFRG